MSLASNSTTTKSTTTKSYIPPSMRKTMNSRQQPHQHNRSEYPTKKTELKKEFSMADAFPTLGETMKTKTTPQLLEKEQQISFSLAASKKAPKEKDTSTSTEQIILPGWVYIRKNKKNQIEYKYGASIIDPNELELEKQNNQRLGNILFKHRIEREQYHRDMDVERLGDLSEFYGQPTLVEMYENDSRLQLNDDELNSSDNEY